MTTIAFFLALGAAAAWAVGMTLAKPAVRWVDPLSYTAVRWIVGAALAAAYGLVTNAFSFPGWGALGYAALAGLLDAAVGGLFYVLSIQRTSAHEATTLSSTAPLWGVAASVLFLAEPARWSAFVAAGLAVAGAFLLVHEPRRAARRRLAGPAFALLTGALWGIAETVPTKLALARGISPALLLLVFSITAVAGTSGLAPFLRSRIPRKMTRTGLLYAAASSAAGAFLGWVLWLLALERAPASLVSPVRGSTVLFAFAYSVVFLRERPRRESFVGAGLVFAGILVITLLT